MSSSTTPVPAPSNIEDDKKKPWKALATFVGMALFVAGRDYFLGADAISPQGLLFALGSALAVAILTFIVKNPKVVASHDDNLRA